MDAIEQFNSGNALLEKGQLDEAIEAFRTAIRLRPDHLPSLCYLAVVLKDRGELDEAVAIFRRLVELSPDNATYHSNLLYTLNFLPNISPADVLAEHRLWSRRHADPLKAHWRAHANDRNPDRRIRIGYASPDFRLHPVGRFILPLLVNHDHGQFETYCYSWVRTPDHLTARCQRYVDVWRDIQAISDYQAAELIRNDGIDILVDLTMHMKGHRPLLFARKPAPVQVTYLAYAGTTGLDAIDYRITDPYLDPPGSPDERYTEKSIRVARSYWCYKPTIRDIPISPPPSTQAGHITFGSLNNFCKVNDGVLDVWAKILGAAANSRLTIHAHVGIHRARVCRRFAGNGIDPQRISFVPPVWIDAYMRQYNQIDICLDTFPYVGGTTTCDALWMGCPVVTLSGNTGISRGGVSILSNVGLPELIAQNPGEYVRLAADLAGDATRLAQLRSRIREQMRRWPLMDAKRFAADMETAYRQIWQTWCGSGGGDV
jgi:predicted O-linked N-acetylglucosamine transferase (SPINDLY family)